MFSRLGVRIPLRSSVWSLGFSMVVGFCAIGIGASTLNPQNPKTPKLQNPKPFNRLFLGSVLGVQGLVSIAVVLLYSVLWAWGSAGS